MKIKLIAFGKLKNPGLRATADHYAAFARSFSEFIEVELKPERVEEKSAEVRKRIQAKEGDLLLEKIGDLRNKALILMDERGKNLTTLDWAKQIERLKNESTSEVIFVIGSSLGFSESVRSQAKMILSLGAQTLAHELARVVVIEQIARALSVNARHPYHHEG